MRVSTSRSSLDHIKRGHGLTSLAPTYGVALRRSGRFLFAHCPFHDDRTPSFIVDERDDHFHCFGCGAHGDVFDFVQRIERVDFRHALERLAGPHDLQIHAASALSSGARDTRTQSATTGDPWRRTVLDAATDWYAIQLWSAPAALAYAARRGLDRGTLERWRVGYCSGEGLADYLRWLDVPLEGARRAGLLQSDGGEPLRDRLIFPERREDRAVWMLGRRLDDAKGGVGPKYLGLPGPKPLFALEAARGHASVFVVEGPIDALVLWQWRLPAVALLGTQARADLLGELARFNHVYLLFDADGAGQAASTALRDALGTRAAPVALPDGRDPADFAREPDGRERLLAAINRAAASVARGEHEP